MTSAIAQPGRAGPTQTALIAAIPEAEPLVGGHRQALDAAASWGVPAHVTILFPFVAPDVLDAEIAVTVARIAFAVPAFHCTFARTGWFDQDVLYLAPEPDQPFRELTRRVWQAFPDYPPYGGDHPDPVPHLTVAETRLADLTAVETVERTVSAGLPLTARIERILLLAGSEAANTWQVLREFPLGGVESGP